MQDERKKARGVALPERFTGSSLFHRLLADAVERFPEALGSVEIPPTSAAFKRTYGATLARFEAARCAAEERVDIARFLARATQQAMAFVDERGHTQPLLEYLAGAPEAVSLSSTRLRGKPGLPVAVPFEGRWLLGQEVLDWVEGLLEARQVTTAVRDAIAWLVRHADADGGALNLENHRFVLMGAGAELAPTRLLLRAGAKVLWVDLADPATALTGDDTLAGELTRSAEANNLLERPREVAAAISEYAGGEPVHLGLYAYAGGETQEWRLGAAMNAIVAHLAPEVVGSVGVLVSPTSPGSLTPDTLAAAQERLRTAPLWQRAAAASGVIRKPGHYTAGEQAIALATVSMQGLSYQAAQYVSKLAAAESYATHGNRLHDELERPLTVSANVAGITRTRSISHPLFEAAFAGAHHFGVRIFEAATTRSLNGLLMLHDLLNPEAPGSAQSPAASARERAARLHVQQVHGGVYGLPFVLEGVIRVAAVAGMARHPSVLRKKATSAEPSPLAAPGVPSSPARAEPPAQPRVH